MQVLLSAGKVKSEDIDIFLKGAGALDINSVRKKPKVSRPCCSKGKMRHGAALASDYQQCAASLVLMKATSLQFVEHSSWGHLC